MKFEEYLAIQTAHIKVENVYKLKKDCNIKINKYNEFLTSNVEKITNLKSTDLCNVFFNFLELGENLYNKNKNDIQKIYVDGTYKISSISCGPSLLNYTENKNNNNLLISWLKNNFFLIIDKDLSNEIFIETTGLVDLSIFIYIVTEIMSNQFRFANNNFTFDILIKSNKQINDYFPILLSILKDFEKRNYIYIQEKTELIYNDKEQNFIPYKIFNNIYSLIWYIFKIYLSFISVKGISAPIVGCFFCGSPIRYPEIYCDDCKRNFPTLKKKLNRKNKKLTDEIKELNDIFDFPNDLQKKIDYILNKKVSYKNHYALSNLLEEMKIYLNM